MISPLRVLREKPWLTPSGANGTPVPELDTAAAAETVLRFVLAIVGILFFLFIITFLSRSQYPDFQALAGAPWQPFSDTTRLWLNTGILGAASVALQTAVWSAGRARLNQTVAGISVGVFFTLLFLLAQLLLWQELQQLGFYLSSNPANSYFYLLTAVHGLHLVGGLVFLGVTSLKRWRGHSVMQLADTLKLCALYWHFLFLVWLVLFFILASPAETINLLAAMCGF